MTNSQYVNTNHALAEAAHFITSSVDKDFYIMSIFVVLTKAFDTVDHTILVKKLDFYGMSGDFMKLYHFYCMQYVFLKTEKIIKDEIVCGVLECSILGSHKVLYWDKHFSICI